VTEDISTLGKNFSSGGKNSHKELLFMLVAETGLACTAYLSKDVTFLMLFL